MPEISSSPTLNVVSQYKYKAYSVPHRHKLNVQIITVYEEGCGYLHKNLRSIHPTYGEDNNTKQKVKVALLLDEARNHTYSQSPEFYVLFLLMWWMIRGVPSNKSNK